MRRPSVFAALIALPLVAGCTTTPTPADKQADNTCHEFGGPTGSTDYAECRKLLSAQQQRDDMLVHRADSITR